ncbi:hypothetical protein [Paraglaciecola sp.]|uniref:hypothetical protein n=1 Tax=Paraglaciecola sp. TaxID=1920173 RepID=UPI003263B7A5
MPKPLSKLLIMTTLLIAFVGQAMGSYVLTFDDVSANQQVNIQQQSAVKGYSDHDANEVDDCCDIDCCEGECFCPENACTSVVYLDNPHAQSTLMLISEFALATVQESPQFFATSLYRPPIFTS